MLRRAAVAFTVWTNDAFGHCGRGFVRPDKAWPLRAPAWQTELEGAMLGLVSHGDTRPRMFTGPDLGRRRAPHLCAHDKTAARRPSRHARSSRQPLSSLRQTPGAGFPPSVHIGARIRPYACSPYTDGGNLAPICAYSGNQAPGVFQKPLQWMPSMPSSSFQSDTRAARSAFARLLEIFRSDRPMSRRARAMMPSM